jgi:hypothetical protein
MRWRAAGIEKFVTVVGVSCGDTVTGFRDTPVMTVD